MSLRFGVLPIAAMLLLFGVLIVACNSDSNDSSNDGDGADATEPAGGGGGDATEPADDGDDDGDGGSPGSGSATLTIGSESWSFDDVFCAFSPEEAGNEFNSFFLSAFGATAEGVRTQLDATILDDQGDGRYEGESVTHSVSLNDVEDFENPAVAWSSLPASFGGGDEAFIKVDGKNVTADALFDDDRTNDVIEEAPGTLVGVCP